MEYQLLGGSHPRQSERSTASAALALFVPEPNKSSSFITGCIPNMSGFSESPPNTISWLGGYFSLAQWQELELQTLIYKYMASGASVPMELILSLKRSVLSTSPYYNHSQIYKNLQPALMQSGYWSSYSIDPEPGRCRRTDGKKWRCSRDVMPGKRYCERHVHRGRNRSRKLVEVPKPAHSGGLQAAVLPSPMQTNKDSHVTQSGSLNQRAPGDKTMDVYLKGSPFSKLNSKDLQTKKHEGEELRRFFDDWPKAEQASNISTNTKTADSGTNLSISISANNSDFSLKLSTGNGDSFGNGKTDQGRVLLPVGNWVTWGSNGEASLGGPLAEVLRSSSASIASPKSVLQKPKGSASETSSIST
ncbi:hypothetical protein HPP92_011604 [Vanilla planifolia]|uniref:Growth-regulating factor n=1 Tax=Vanilla planifolia TaxID=51239 RepID=A0A835R1I4_VANPL|nr:hypothetical protein HPP92_011894 [Vanilla planifolia]KAG0483520.1 hypothetical protein HPP92_011604 [Vanilla planifolia]